MKNKLIYLFGPFICIAMIFTACAAANGAPTPQTNGLAEGPPAEDPPAAQSLSEATGASAHNVILIIADDFGVDMVALYNESAADLPPTPNIDALLDEGVLFENAWTNPICSPTRAAMLTGRYGFRTGVGDPVANTDEGIRLSEFTLPEAITAGSSFDYTHANIGKWHLSSQQNGARDNPNLSGYDHFSGVLRGGLRDYSEWTKVVNGTNVDVTNYATTETVNDAISWIDDQNQQDKPFFLWLAFNAPHSPFHLPPLDLHSYDDLAPTGESDRDYYKAMVEAMDTEIGRLLDSLPADVRANTTVVFIGDNGTPGQVVQSPLTRHSAKGSLYDGGVHVPLIISGPKVASPGRTLEALVNSVDMFATVLELMGIDVAETVPMAESLDSVSMVPYMSNTTHTEAREWVFAERFGSNERADYAKAIRDEQYKLIVFEDGDVELYDLQSDQFEANNLLAAGASLSADQQMGYCALVTDITDLLQSEPGQTLPQVPEECG
ncbi:MAG: sulfatase-like hydrolase/transferase [Anaerolineae bacterium]